MRESKFSSKKVGPTRRQFGRAVAGSALGAVPMPAIVRGRNLNEKLNIAVIGVGGRGAANLAEVTSENIVALCDADRNNCADQLKKYSAAKFYQNFRKMLDEMGSGIDAVDVATPDHFHAIAASAVTLGAFPLAPSGSDSAVLITLPPGNYTAEVSSGDGTTGVALVEIYKP